MHVNVEFLNTVVNELEEFVLGLRLDSPQHSAQSVPPFFSHSHSVH